LKYQKSEEIALKNLDNGILIFKHIICNGEICKELCDITIEKNESFSFAFIHKKGIKFEKSQIIMVVEDILKNKYYYKFIYNGNILLGFEELTNYIEAVENGNNRKTL